MLYYSMLSTLYSLIKQIFIKHPVCARYYSSAEHEAVTSIMSQSLKGRKQYINKADSDRCYGVRGQRGSSWWQESRGYFQQVDQGRQASL